MVPTSRHFITALFIFLALSVTGCGGGGGGVPAGGTLDTSFGTGGKVTTAIGTSAAAWALAIQPDDKLVAAGDSFTGAAHVFALVRYLP